MAGESGLPDDHDPSVRAEALVALGNLAGKGAPPAELKSLSPPVDQMPPRRTTPMRAKPSDTAAVNSTFRSL
jgi:hypothetical protein